MVSKIYDALFPEQNNSIEIPFNENGYRKLKIENLTHFPENKVKHWEKLHLCEEMGELYLPIPFDEKPTKEQLKSLEQSIVQLLKHELSDTDSTVYILPPIIHLNIDAPGYLVYPRVYLKTKVENERHGKLYYKKLKSHKEEKL